MLKNIVIIFILSLLLFRGFPLLAAEFYDVDALIDLAKTKQLSRSKQWLGLLHFNQGGTLHSKNTSYVKSSKFFLSTQGNVDPEAELIENVKHFFGGDSKRTPKDILNKNMAARCQFPARFNWLSKQLNLSGYYAKLSHCDEFLASQKLTTAKSLVLVFPSAYVNSASSIFGHTLLRIDGVEVGNTKLDNTQVDSPERDLNSVSSIHSSPILSWAINFGANFDENDGALSYAAKGISGKYSGQYFVVPYAQKIKEYGQMENRDIWEYPLSLSANEVNFLIEHLWELRDIQFDYYFFDENCSYRLLELIEIARPTLDLSSQFRLAELPIDTAKALNEAKLIKSTNLRPSKERILRKKFKDLGRERKSFAKKLSKEPDLAKSEAFQNLENQEKINLLDISYHYLRFKQAQSKRNSLSAKHSLQLLTLINQYSLANKGSYPLINQHSNPNISIKEHNNYLSSVKQKISVLDSHDSQRLGLSLGKNEGSNYQSVEYRMAYHDHLDNSIGFPNGASIEALGIKVKRSESEVFIDQLTLFDIISLNPIDDIRQDFSWNIGIKAERGEENNQHLHSIFEAGGGLDFRFRSVDFYQLLIPRIEVSPESEKNIDIGAALKIGILVNSGRHPFLLEATALKIKNQEIKESVRLSQQIELSQHQGFRLQANYFKQSNVNVKSAEITYLRYF